MPVIDLANYTLQKSEHSFCGHCNTPVHLLCPHENTLGNQNLRTFFLCESCGQISEAGRGPLNLPEKSRSKPLCATCNKAIATQKCAKCKRWFCIGCVAVGVATSGSGCEKHIRCMKCFKKEYPSKKTEARLRKWEKKNATPPTPAEIRKWEKKNGICPNTGTKQPCGNQLCCWSSTKKRKKY